MTIILLIITSVLAICGIIYLSISNLAKNSQRAITEFNKFSNPGRESSLAELQEFTQKWHRTASLTHIFHKYFGFITSTLDESVTFFQNYEEYHRQNNELHNSIIATEDWAIAFERTLNEYFSHHYFTHSEKEHIVNDNQVQISELHRLYPLYKEFFTIKGIPAIFETLRHLENLRKEHNISYVQKEIALNKEFFDNTLSYPLDAQQREAIVKEEDNTLIISGAGSGKTSTIIGKLHYLIKVRRVRPEQILALSYTKSAAQQLRKRLDDTHNVNCSTFHKLALDIITEVEGRRPSICDNSLILTLFHNLIQTNPEYKKHVYNYITRQQSLMKLSHQYQTVHDYVVSRKKYGVMSPFLDCQGRLIFTKSEEEKRLCILLTELGINFLYEEYYPYQGNPNSNSNYRHYKPDFTLLIPDTIKDPVSGTDTPITRRVYLEHFAIDASGNVPRWFADHDPNYDWENQNRKYNEGIIWKRATHAANGTRLIETTSADFHRPNNIRDVLIQKLKEANIPINERSKEECYSKLVHLDRTEAAVGRFLEQFITIAKSNKIDIQNFLNNAHIRGDKRAIYIINNLVKPLFEAYSNELQIRKEIDFVDAINKASEYCQNGRYAPNYSHILVDEFQDISIDRFRLLQSIRNQWPLTKLFCVGDDWQSIYRFGGSDISLFYRFEEFFGVTETLSISTTYRLQEPLLSISSDFIMRNPEQTRRTITPYTSEQPTEIQLVSCGPTKEHQMRENFMQICNNIPQDESMMILGRYNYDVKTIDPKIDTNSDPIQLSVNNRQMTYYSVHKSKGLEADNVILINCHSGVYGFPSLIEDDPVLSYLLSDADGFENAEERRLFYVALTRAKKKIYILYYSDTPSPFLTELNHATAPDEQICPICGDGNIVKLGDYIAVNGNHYSNFGCTNYQNGCQYFVRKFTNTNSTD